MRDIIVISFIMLSFLFTSLSPVLADSDHHHYQYDDVLEEVGEFLGWGSIILGGVAFALLPIRRSVKFLVKVAPTSTRKKISSLLRILTKLHMPMGITSLLFIVSHGVLMYLDEGKLSLIDLLGVVSLGSLILATLFGILLWKTKNRSTRKIHLILVTISAALAVIHIALS